MFRPSSHHPSSNRSLAPLAFFCILVPGLAVKAAENPLLEAQRTLTELYQTSSSSVVGIRVRLTLQRMTEITTDEKGVRITVTGPFGTSVTEDSMTLRSGEDRGGGDRLERPVLARGPVDRHGTGIVYDTSGHVVTTYRLIHDCTPGALISVSTDDGRDFTARIRGSDPHTNVAVLQVPGLKGTPAIFSSSNPAQTEVPAPGTFVFCIARPYGLPNSAGYGIVSGVNRTLGQVRYERLIQTTVPLHPGSNGAPLFLLDGSVAGMLSCTLKQPDWSEVSFAIPSFMLVEVVERLIRQGEIARGFLGVRVANLSELRAQGHFNTYQGPLGAVVIGIVADTAAEKADLRFGDVITRIDGERIETREDLMWKMSRVQPGESVTIEFFRDETPTRRAVSISSLPTFSSPEPPPR